MATPARRPSASTRLVPQSGDSGAESARIAPANIAFIANTSALELIFQAIGENAYTADANAVAAVDAPQARQARCSVQTAIAPSTTVASAAPCAGVSTGSQCHSLSQSTIAG